MPPFAKATGGRPGIANATGGRAGVHQVLATLGYGDAIGNEVLGIQRVLRGAGYESEIFVETAEPRVRGMTVDYLDLQDASDPDNILIHHFSIGSRASRVAYALPDRMVLIYHNITPPEYFIDVHPPLVGLCFLGRRELGLYRDRCDLALGDSEYNRQELEAIGFPKTGVLPVVPDFSHLARDPNRRLAAQFDDEWTNLLFVGRTIPNKRLEDVIRWFHAYKRWFNQRSRLLFVGEQGGFERYVATLNQLIAELGTSDVHFLGHVTNEELVAFYEVADVFLCASEHEGFCVPLIESFYMGVPVIAFAATAVPATMDGGGVLIADKDPIQVAGLIDRIVTDRVLQDRILGTQDAALERLVAKDFGGMLLRFIDEVRRAPPRPHPPVEADFWEQVRHAEELRSIRKYRPAAFQVRAKEAASKS